MMRRTYGNGILLIALLGAQTMLAMDGKIVENTQAVQRYCLRGEAIQKRNCYRLITLELTTLKIFPPVLAPIIAGYSVTYLQKPEVQAFIDSHPISLQYLYAYPVLSDRLSLSDILDPLEEGDRIRKKTVAVSDKGYVEVWDSEEGDSYRWSPLTGRTVAQKASVPISSATKLSQLSDTCSISSRLQVVGSLSYLVINKEKMPEGKTAPLFCERDFLYLLTQRSQWIPSPRGIWLMAHGNRKDKGDDDDDYGGATPTTDDSFTYMICTQPAHFLASAGVVKGDLEIFAFLNLYMRAVKVNRNISEPDQRIEIALPLTLRKFIEQDAPVLLRQILHLGACITYESTDDVSAEVYNTMGELENDFGCTYGTSYKFRDLFLTKTK